MQQVLSSSLLITGLLLYFGYFVVFDTTAQVRQSSNYQIESDSLNTGGGLSSSTNFVQESTVGEVATSEGGSSNFNLFAGYQQMQEVYIALAGANDVVMSPDIGGVSGGTATGSTTVTVTTDSRAGYQLTIQASTSPALQSSLDSIADYVPAGAVPDFTFDFGSSDAYFGYSPEGADVDARFLDNGTDTCGVGGAETSDRCWDGLSTSAVVIATDTDANHPNGATTTVRFQTGLGGSSGKTVGVYYATTTVTALPL